MEFWGLTNFILTMVTSRDSKLEFSRGLLHQTIQKGSLPPQLQTLTGHFLEDLLGVVSEVIQGMSLGEEFHKQPT